MRRAHLGLALLALATGCSFLTDFGEIEPLGGASAQGGHGGAGGGAGGAGGGVGLNGAGGAGGAPMCTPSACENCLLGNAMQCPTQDEIQGVVLSAPVSPPAESSQSGVVLGDGVTWSGSNNAAFIAHFIDRTGSNTFSVGSQPLNAVLSAGVLFDASGTVLGAASPCTDAGTDPTPGDETFFFGLAPVLSGANQEVAIAGAFEGQRARWFSSTQDCSDLNGSRIQGPTGNVEQFVPFLAWAGATTQNQGLKRTLTPLAASSGNGYLSDVAAVPGATDGDVIAIGLAQTNPFGVGVGFSDNYYLVHTAGPNPTDLAPLPFFSCQVNHYDTLDGIRSSVAVDSDDAVWFAGTGCPTNGGHIGVDRAFLGRTSLGLGDFSDTRAFGTDNGGAVSITEVAVSDAVVVVAGSYQFTVVDQLEDGSTPDTADGDDAFVMAFTRQGWNNVQKPVWFRRFASEGPVTIQSLIIDNGRVFIAGQSGQNIASGDVRSCFTDDPPPGRGRAFFAMMSELEGNLDWIRVEGFTPSTQPPPVADAYFATGTLLLPITGAAWAATGEHGLMQLDCADSATMVDRPSAALHLLNL